MRIAGLVYYSRNAYGYEDHGARPVTQGAVVTLYKWNGEEAAWEQVDLGENNPTPTDVYGKYVFDNVSGVGVAWFKITVDAEGKVPDGRLGYIQERVVSNQVRPVGIPDAGIIRADVKYVWNYQLLVEEPAQPWYRGFEGHFVRFLEGGETEMPNMGMALSPPPHIGQCTPGSGDLTFIGCADGHWYSFVAAGVDPVWEVWLEAGWAHYIFRRPFNEGDPPGPVIGEGYSYWDPARPRWGLHGAHSGGQDMGGDTNWKVIVDFVDTALPE